MPDENLSGETEGGGRLSNSQLEAQAGEYSPELHGGEGGMSKEEWDAQPGWKKGVTHRMAVRRSEADRRATLAEGALEQTRREMAEIKTMLQQQGQAKPEPERLPGLQGAKTQDIESFISVAEETLIAIAQDPTNEELRTQAAKIKPNVLTEARRELARRDAVGAVGEREKVWSAQKQNEQAQGALLSRLRQDFGDAAVDPRSDLLRGAAEELRSMAEERRLFGDAAASYMAVERVHTRMYGDGRAITENERARLGIESGVRREASPMNEINALRQKGDWKSRGQATDKSIGHWLDAIYGDGA